MDHPHRTFVLSIIFQLLFMGSAAQGTTAPGLLEQRPRYHFSMGGERSGVTPMWYGGGQADLRGLRYSFMARLKGNFLVGASMAGYGDQVIGTMFLEDSSRYIPGGFVDGGPFFGTWWSPARTEQYGDRMMCTLEGVDTYQLFGGYTLPDRWPRSMVFVTGSGTLGVMASRVREQHTYYFNELSGFGDVPDDQKEVSDIGWAVAASLRMDLHFSKFFSVYMELATVQQVVGLNDLGSTGHMGDESMSVPAERRSFSTTRVQSGIAFHL